MVRLDSCRGAIFGAMVVVSGMMVGCGGATSSGSTASTAEMASPTSSSGSAASTSSTSSALTISGTPATSVVAGQAYAFRPAVTDTSGGTVQYSVAGKPAWATFNSTTGALTGTPTTADVGVNVGVLISASNGTDTVQLPVFEITVASTGAATNATSTLANSASGGSSTNSVLGAVTMQWVAPTLNTNGSTLTNLSGYKVYYGTVSQQYTSSVTISNPAATSYLIQSLAVGKQYYFAVTSVSAAGVESAYSPEVTAIIS